MDFSIDGTALLINVSAILLMVGLMWRLSRNMAAAEQRQRAETKEYYTDLRQELKAAIAALRQELKESTNKLSVRSADEFRIQITNGPQNTSAFDTDGAVDLLVGYSRHRGAIVAYDRRWLEKWTQKKETSGSGGSPSVQVKSEDIQAGLDEGIHHLAKSAAFGAAGIVTMRPTSPGPGGRRDAEVSPTAGNRPTTYFSRTRNACLGAPKPLRDTSRVARGPSAPHLTLDPEVHE